jgi:quercetin dioxygenase-like cupin family protein
MKLAELDKPRPDVLGFGHHEACSPILEERKTMVEREAMREREAEVPAISYYEELFRLMEEEKGRLEKGRYVIKGKDIPWEHGRQAIVKWYLHPGIADTALQTMQMFVHEIRTHSGRHRHQGGLALFVLRGKGYTTVDGVPHEWEEGDLILLPIKPGGVEHQHFNTDPSQPSRWVALSPRVLTEHMGRILEQKAVHPDWKGTEGG